MSKNKQDYSWTSRSDHKSRCFSVGTARFAGVKAIPTLSPAIFSLRSLCARAKPERSRRGAGERSLTSVKRGMP